MAKPTPVHAPMDQFAQQANQLLIGGHTLDDIARLLDKAVFYAYDTSVVKAQIDKFHQHIPAPIKLHYAIKANPYAPLVNTMRDWVEGFDVASQKEMLLALQTGMPADDISFAGPSKQEAEIEAAIVAGVTLHVESALELSRAVSLGEQLGKKPKVAFRVNPAFELKASGMKMGGGPKQFGLDEEFLFDWLPTLDYNTFEFRGFHIFWGSQNLKVDAITEAHTNTFALADKLVKATPVPTRTINIGGGFGIPYFPGEQRLELAPIGENLTALLQQYPHLAALELIIELGRYLVAEAGVYASRITDIKTSRGHTFVMTNGGLHHHLSNSGNFGQVIRKNYPVAIGNKLGDGFEKTLVTAVGPLCTPLDTLADKMALNDPQLGDWLVVFQSGAYGPTASPQDFLGHPHVHEICL
ncbi:pyridoxal-dependent decarboxylase, exosortase A system-associated [Aestuariibacter halophilus]|uniref:Pyridoxal-dependent decarboxylase, exosortase A system-associated n=1 Tax=Fluctibacter halophilus TaxID=226011 RepID=A0ABS8G2R7_9ALTE|nr:pyridoxal-dependent decarboxylase, exosortase A system-associated [Aestuariibacter halophilus]MCC2614882.1 pyridoxal-dependent decarboxylase, exosortase A system-associated [Aestuariibacter halophilus]